MADSSREPQAAVIKARQEISKQRGIVIKIIPLSAGVYPDRAQITRAIVVPIVTPRN